MPQFTINNNVLGFVISILTIMGMSFAGFNWVSSEIATRAYIDDVLEKVSQENRQQALQIKLQYLDLTIKLTEVSLIGYESRLDSLTVQEQREYEQLKAVHQKQLESYAEMTNAL